MRGPDAKSIALNLSTLLHLPGLKSVLEESAHRCPTCGMTHIQLALDELVGERGQKGCLRGKVVSVVIQKAMMIAAGRLGVGKSSLRKTFRDPYFRRGLASVIRGMADFGISEPFTPGAPFLVVWNYTNVCNLRCRHCYQTAGRSWEEELRTDEKKRIVNELADEGVVSIAFSGGEPLVAKDFFEVASLARQKGIYVSLASNGTLIDRATAAKIKASGIGYAEISLDGSRAGIHDAIRGVPGAFDRTIKGIKNLQEEGVDTCIAFTAMQANYDDVSSVVNMAKRMGVDRIIVFNWIPAGRGSANKADDLSPEKREDLLSYLYELTVSGELLAMSTAPQFARVSLQRSERGVICPTHFAAYTMPGETARLAGFIGGCGAGRLYIALQPDGKVTPCVFMPTVVVGDLRKDKFADLWRNDRTFAALRDRGQLRGPCGSCAYKMECGGCRARALGYTGDILESDPGCVLVKQQVSVRN